MKYFKECKVLRISGNELKILWKIDEEVEVSIFLLTDSNEKIIGRVLGKNEFIIKDFYNKKRCFFMLRAYNYHSEILSERQITLEGACNFRDLGGYKSEDGRRVKWNKFYRSDRLSSLSEEDIRYIKNMGIKNILDLRSKAEIKANPDIKIQGVKYINISKNNNLNDKINNLNIISLFNSGVIYSHDIEKILISIYFDMLFNNNALRKIVEYMESEEKLPLVIHGSSGKDRTGIVSLFILSILGVPKKIIKEDYMASNLYRKDLNEKLIESLDKKIISKDKVKLLSYVLEVKEKFIDAVFDEIDRRYGSLDNYLEKEYGLTRKKRKELKKELLY